MKKVCEWLIDNLHDLLIILAIIIFIGTMFVYVSPMVGLITTSVAFFICGLLLSILRGTNFKKK